MPKVDDVYIHYVARLAMAGMYTFCFSYLWPVLLPVPCQHWTHFTV